MGEAVTLDEAIRSLSANDVADVTQLDILVGDTIRCYVAPINYTDPRYGGLDVAVIVERLDGRYGTLLGWFTVEQFIEALAKTLGVVVR